MLLIAISWDSLPDDDLLEELDARGVEYRIVC